jgi:hypothetical protein
MTDKEKMADLLSSQPLYKKVLVERSFFEHPTSIGDLTFSFYCPLDNSYQTFKLALEPNRLLRELWGKAASDKNYFDTFDHSDSKYKFTQHYSATCQYCKKYKADFLLQLETNKSIPVNNVSPETYVQPMQIVKKIGQYPPYEITPDKDLIGFLTEEDQGNYKKALICRSQDYGIGAFAYLRRIVENEMLRIVEDLSRIDKPESKQIKALLETFRTNHIMTNLIDGIYAYLPASLQSLGDNPLKVLYSQLSGGIHEFSEEECSEKASTIDTLLKFVVKKVNEENSEVRAARDAIKNLKS